MSYIGQSLIASYIACHTWWPESMFRDGRDFASFMTILQVQIMCIGGWKFMLWLATEVNTDIFLVEASSKPCGATLDYFSSCVENGNEYASCARPNNNIPCSAIAYTVAAGSTLLEFCFGFDGECWLDHLVREQRNARGWLISPRFEGSRSRKPVIH